MSWGAPETENQSAWGRGSRKGEEPGVWEVGGAGVALSSDGSGVGGLSTGTTRSWGQVREEQSQTAFASKISSQEK